MSTQTKTLIGCLILLTAIIFSIETPKPIQPIKKENIQPNPEPEKPKVATDYSIDEWIILNAERIKIDPDMIRAIIDVESKWDYNAISETNDYGLMQINEKYIKEYFEMSYNFNKQYGLTCNASDARANITMGCNALHYWRKMARLSDYPQISKYQYIGAYNNGFEGLKHPNEPYIEKVLTTYGRIKEQN